VKAIHLKLAQALHAKQPERKAGRYGECLVWSRLINVVAEHLGLSEKAQEQFKAACRGVVVSNQRSRGVSMTLTKDEVRALRNSVQMRLNLMEVSVGFKLKLGNATYGGDCVTFKLECGRLGADGGAASKEAQDFKSAASYYGLSPDDLGKTFSWQGASYTITGLRRRARRAPILASRSDGRLFKFGADAVRFGLMQAREAGSPRTGKPAPTSK
jgi:hypothetical protein